MGTKLVKNCCEAKQNSSYLNITSDIGQSFEYQDDEAIVINPVTYTDDPLDKKAMLEFGSNIVKLNSSMPLEVPVRLTFNCPKPSCKLGNDVVFVIELSSATSPWMQSIKSTLATIIDSLSANDRVGIIGYNSRVFKLSGMVAGNVSGKLKLERIVRDMQTDGAADVLEAVRLGLFMLKTRLFVNNNASVVLMSLTGDEYPDTVVERAENCLSEFKDLDYSFYAFGLGDRHNADLLNYLSRTGSYTYLAHPETVNRGVLTAFESVMLGKVHHLTLSLSVSSLVPVEISKIFHHPSCVDYGRTLSIVFLLTFNTINENTKDRIHLNAKISHKFEYFESSGTLDIYGKAWNVDSSLNECVTLDFFKEKTIQNLVVALEQDFTTAVKVLEGIIVEGKLCSISQNDKLLKFLSKIEVLKQEIVSSGCWTEALRAQIYSFIRVFWGSSLKTVSFD